MTRMYCRAVTAVMMGAIPIPLHRMHLVGRCAQDDTFILIIDETGCFWCWPLIEGALSP